LQELSSILSVVNLGRKLDETPTLLKGGRKPTENGTLEKLLTPTNLLDSLIEDGENY
jgi:hypothetical protein